MPYGYHSAIAAKKHNIVESGCHLQVTQTFSQHRDVALTPKITSVSDGRAIAVEKHCVCATARNLLPRTKNPLLILTDPDSIEVLSPT